MSIDILENYFEQKVIQQENLKYSDLKIMEMGSEKRHCDRIKNWNNDVYQNSNYEKMIEHNLFPKCGAKYYYKKILNVAEHTSIDFNGHYESISTDLNEPVPSEHLNRYNFYTNYGTGEHVTSQYSFFKNSHDVCEQGCIMIHALNAEGYAPGHARWNYKKEFIENLANANNYQILLFVGKDVLASEAGVLPFQLVCSDTRVYFVAYKKLENNSFVSESDFNKLGLIDTGDTRRMDRYNG